MGNLSARSIQAMLPAVLRMKLLAYSKWDIVPVLCGLAHFAFVLTFFAVFPIAPWWVLVSMGFTYSVSISWNINGISHNFLHNPYFKSHLLNRIFSLIESLAMGFSQTFYEYVHQRHHMGNSDRPDEHGETIDWLSIYRHGHDGEAENIWSYVFLSYFRDDPKAIYREIARRNPSDAFWGVFEIVAFLSFFVLLGFLNWHFIVFFLPFYYFGHCLSYLNGYYLHYRRQSRQADRVGREQLSQALQLALVQQRLPRRASFPPKMHWTKMDDFHRQIADQQRREGVRVIIAAARAWLSRPRPCRKKAGRCSRKPTCARTSAVFRSQRLNWLSQTCIAWFRPVIFQHCNGMTALE